jgi:8-amino-7-oxononanoate synthase
LRILESGKDLRQKLHDNAARLHAGLAALGYNLGGPPSPVVAVVLEGKVEALQFWDSLLKLGVYVNLMLPPATPNGVSLIRCSVSAAHTSEQIDAVCAAFAKLRTKA